ncbi:MAG: hypothetical protein ACREVI_00615 [Steroidobacteraceae bacterium]
MKTILPVQFLALSLDASAIPDWQPQVAGSTLQSYQEARSMLGCVLESAGGEAAIRRLRNISLSYSGHRNMINQSRRAHFNIRASGGSAAPGR